MQRSNSQFRENRTLFEHLGFVLRFAGSFPENRVLSPISGFICEFPDSPAICRIRGDTAFGLTFSPFLIEKRLSACHQSDWIVSNLTCQ
jgi:hypothetical protein